MGADSIDRFPAIAGQLHMKPGSAKEFHGNLLVDRMVLYQ